MIQNKTPLLEVKHLKQYFNVGSRNEVKAVDDVTFNVYEGETYGLVGESGSGKTTVGKSIVRLLEPTGGDIIFDGKNVTDFKSYQQLKTYHKDVQMIFQDPYASLNPRMTVAEIIGEGLVNYNLITGKKELRERVRELLDQVGLNAEHASRYPREFSGGQRQRIGIARALAVKPKLIVADEAISALDVSIQAQVINLLLDLQEELNLTYLFIAHDLSMVKFISDRIGVMNSGKMLEAGSTDEIYYHPLHPYTQSLLSAIPLPEPLQERERHRIKYEKQPLSGNEAMHLIGDSHYVYCTDEEIDKYQKRRLEYLEKM